MSLLITAIVGTLFAIVGGLVYAIEWRKVFANLSDKKLASVHYKAARSVSGHLFGLSLVLSVGVIGLWLHNGLDLWLLPVPLLLFALSWSTRRGSRYLVGRYLALYAKHED